MASKPKWNCYDNLFFFLKISARTDQLIDCKTNCSPYQTKLNSTGLPFYFFMFLKFIREVEFGERKVPVSYGSPGFAGKYTCVVVC